MKLRENGLTALFRKLKESEGDGFLDNEAKFTLVIILAGGIAFIGLQTAMASMLPREPLMECRWLDTGEKVGPGFTREPK